MIFDTDKLAMNIFIAIIKHYPDLDNVNVAQSPITFNWVERGWVTMVELRDTPSPSVVYKLTDDGHAILAFKDL